MNATWRGFVRMLRWVVALVFCYAGWLKLQSPQAFADNIATFRLLPVAWVNLLAFGLPPFELLVSLLLLCGWQVRTAAFGSLLACVIFLLALISAMIRQLPVECGCFGDAPSSLSPTQRLWLAVGRDVLLAGATFVVYLDARRRAFVERYTASQIG